MEKLISRKDKRNKRHAVSIRPSSYGVSRLWRRRITRSMSTRGESCPGLPHFFWRPAFTLRFLLCF